MKRYRVKPGSRVDLSAHNAADKGAFEGGKTKGQEATLDLNQHLEELQEMLYAEHKHKVLVVLQGMDTSGKDGVVRHVFEGVNPQGVRVASFKVPTAVELDHDYLWRIHQHVPGKGEVVIFNRSHYEDLLVVRVHELVPPRVWKKRFAQINAWERMLVEEGTTILKFFLHISLEEQKARMQERLDTPHKRWKFRLGDLEERKLWPAYVEAYEDVLSKTSTRWAPWYIVPSDREWYRNLTVASILVETLKELKMAYPEPEDDLTNVIID